MRYLVDGQCECMIDDTAETVGKEEECPERGYISNEIKREHLHEYETDDNPLEASINDHQLFNFRILVKDKLPSGSVWLICRQRKEKKK